MNRCPLWKFLTKDSMKQQRIREIPYPFEDFQWKYLVLVEAGEGSLLVFEVIENGEKFGD